MPLFLVHPVQPSLWTDITMLLALSVYQLIVIEKLPTTSDAVPLLGISDSIINQLSATTS